jgi:uncharacterized protein (TIGR03067 family)
MRGMTPTQVLEANIRLADAQSAVARHSGFESWPALSRYVEQLRALEGTWEFVYLEIEGKEQSRAFLTGAKIEMDGDCFRSMDAFQTYEGVFTIDVEETPHHIDINFVNGPHAGASSYGIFETEGDDLTICLGLVGSSRPTSFTTSPDTGHALERLVRSSRSRPEGVTGGTETPVVVREVEPVALTPEHKLLEGEWLALEVVRDGIPLPGPMVSVGKRVGDGTRMTVSFGGQVMLEAESAINAGANPIEVDYFLTNPGMQGLTLLGIMEWTAEGVQFCFGQPGQGRPGAFESKPGSGHTFSRWRKP